MGTHDLAYLAGVLDTFAHLSTRTTTADSILPLVEVNSPDLALLRWLGAITNITPIETRRNYVKGGCSLHCAEKHIHVRSTSGRWSVVGAKATIVLAGVRPYIRLRPERVDELIALGMEATWRPQTQRDMRERGWKIPSRSRSPRPPASGSSTTGSSTT